MYYPWWHVPGLTSPMLIAVVAVLHVIVSHYAVGGGMFLAVEVRHAYKTARRDYLDYLKKHATFFILLTVVYGAITGVGIWWTVGLASPLATEVLIRTFVFGWAIEYVFFILEIVAGFIFYYYWGRLTERMHVLMGAVYGFSAWMSLVVITGITGFMLSPGQAWLADRNDFWAGFFNPQFVPQVIARTGGSFLLTSLFVYLHASLFAKDPALRNLVEHRSARPALLGAVLITLGGALWFWFLPERSKAVIEAAAPLNILMALLFALTVIVFIFLYLGPYRNPGWLNPGFAATLLLFGFAAFSMGEFVREAVRKPYIIHGVVYGNQIYVEDVGPVREKGYLESGLWTRAFVRREYPALVADGRIDEARFLELPREDRLRLGQTLFQYHCNDCHAVRRGYSAIAPLIRRDLPDEVVMDRERLRRTRAYENLVDDIIHLEKPHLSMPPMPPWAGTREEAEILAEYLIDIAPQFPADVFAPPLARQEAR